MSTCKQACLLGNDFKSESFFEKKSSSNAGATTWLYFNVNIYQQEGGGDVGLSSNSSGSIAELTEDHTLSVNMEMDYMEDANPFSST